MHPRVAAWATAALLGSCVRASPPTRQAELTVVDLSAATGFAENSLGHYKRGRTCAPADFDGDGRLDLFVGSPQDPAVVLYNIGTEPGEARFEALPISDYGRTFWAAAALDLDDDGDIDLFAGTGGNETEELDAVFWNEGGALVEGPVDMPLSGPEDVLGDPVPTATAGARWADIDLDGDLDLFLSTNVLDPGEYNAMLPLQPHGRDRLLLNKGDGVFEDATLAAGLYRRDPSFNSSLIDYDNDGDPDLYQSTQVGLNRLWKNHFVETGTVYFTDITQQVSPDGAVRLVDPLIKSFSTASADLNNDGWQDLIVWHRGPTGKAHKMDRHLVWLNLGGTRFVEVGDRIGLAKRWHDCEDYGRGVMGSQVADIDGDGFIDIFIGNGSPDGGCHNQLWLSDGLRPLKVAGWGEVLVPLYRDASETIDFPVEGADLVPFPYRTHGACIADYDDDGRPELAFVNGGPGWADDWVREPNRYFDIIPDPSWHFVTIRPHGDGVAVAREAIGTRIRARLRRSSDGAEWEVHRMLHGGSGFAAHNGPDLFIGMADADEVLELELRWPDGEVAFLETDTIDQRIDAYR